MARSQLNAAGGFGPLNGLLIPVAGVSYFLSVTDTADDFTAEMEAGEHFIFTCTTDCYIAQGDTPEAEAADGSMLVPRGLPILIDGAQGAVLSVIRVADDGAATLQQVKVTR